MPQLRRHLSIEIAIDDGLGFWAGLGAGRSSGMTGSKHSPSSSSVDFSTQGLAVSGRSLSAVGGAAGTWLSAPASSFVAPASDVSSCGDVGAAVPGSAGDD